MDGFDSRKGAHLETIQLNIGMSRSGKTYALMREVERTEGRIFIVDRLREFIRDGKCQISVDSIAVAHNREHLRKAIASDARVVIYQTERVRFVETSWELMRKRERAYAAALQADCCVIADHVLDTGSTLVTPEVHFIAPNNGALPGPLDELAGAFRHYGASWLADSQRPSLVAPRLQEQAETIRIFATAGRIDRKTIRDYLGDSALDSVDECARRLSKKDPGWHVRIDPRFRVPPYPLCRYVTDEKTGRVGVEIEKPMGQQSIDYEKDG